MDNATREEAFSELVELAKRRIISAMDAHRDAHWKARLYVGTYGEIIWQQRQRHYARMIANAQKQLLALGAFYAR